MYAIISVENSETIFTKIQTFGLLLLKIPFEVHLLLNVKCSQQNCYHDISELLPIALVHAHYYGNKGEKIVLDLIDFHNERCSIFFSKEILKDAPLFTAIKKGQCLCD